MAGGNRPATGSHRPARSAGQDLRPNAEHAGPGPGAGIHPETQSTGIPAPGRKRAFFLPRLFFRAASHTRLRLAKVELVHDQTGAPGLLVHRFDRIPQADRLRPLAVEDSCQVLDRCCEPLAKKSVFPADSPPASFVNNSQPPTFGSENLTSSHSMPTGSATCDGWSVPAPVTFSPIGSSAAREPIQPSS